jgi:predicted nucleic acid-binding protein
VADFVIVDTDILIDAGRGVAQAVSCLQAIERESSLATSAVTQMELLVGSRNRNELRDIERFVSRFQVIKISGAASDMAVDLLRRYRLSHGLLIGDALIAATALVVEAPLISTNQRDYRLNSRSQSTSLSIIL